jgi:hypothetical protein
MASRPYMDALRGASFSTMPSNTTSGRRGNTGFGAGDFNPTVSFGQSGILPLGLDSNGLPRGTYNQMEMPSNTFVQVTYMVTRWANGSEAHILPGMLFFLQRVPTDVKLGKKTMHCNTIVTIGHLNQILYNAWMNVTQKLVRNDPKARQFFRLMRMYGERELSFAAQCVQSNDTLGLESDLLQLLEMCREEEAYALCASPAMIMDRYNFGGVVYNRSNDVTMDGVASLDSLEYIYGLNTISSHLAEVHDIFPQAAEMGVGSDLYLHIRRRPVAAPPADMEGYSFGSFVIEPIACFSQTRPVTANSYRDMAGRTQSGFLLELGKVHMNGSRQDSLETQRIASGVAPSVDLKLVRAATARLDKITINLLKLK